MGVAICGLKMSKNASNSHTHTSKNIPTGSNAFSDFTAAFRAVYIQSYSAHTHIRYTYVYIIMYIYIYISVRYVLM